MNIPLAVNPGRVCEPSASRTVFAVLMESVACNQGLPACVAMVLSFFGREWASGRGMTGYQTK